MSYPNPTSDLSIEPLQGVDTSRKISELAEASGAEKAFGVADSFFALFDSRMSTMINNTSGNSEVGQETQFRKRFNDRSEGIRTLGIQNPQGTYMWAQLPDESGTGLGESVTYATVSGKIQNTLSRDNKMGDIDVVWKTVTVTDPTSGKKFIVCSTQTEQRKIGDYKDVIRRRIVTINEETNANGQRSWDQSSSMTHGDDSIASLHRMIEAGDNMVLSTVIDAKVTPLANHPRVEKPIGVMMSKLLKITALMKLERFRDRAFYLKQSEFIRSRIRR